MTRTTRPLRVEPLEDRLAPAAGDLDPTFGTNGVVAIGQTVNANPFTPLPGGGAVVVTGPSDGTNLALVKFNADGTQDAAFGTGGKAALPDNVPGTLTATPDGGIVYAGLLTGGSATADIVLVRLTPTGQPDPAFGTGGTATIGFNVGPGADNPTDLVVAPDGRIFLAGAAHTAAGFAPLGTSEFAAARLTADGKLDPAFGTGGVALVPFPVGNFSFTGSPSVALQPDGRVVLGSGVAADLPAGSPLPVNDFAAVRLTSDGQLDSTFGDGGRVRIPRDAAATGLNYVGDVAVRPDGRIVLAGGQEHRTDLTSPADSLVVGVRLTPDGQLDPTYGNGGIGHSLPQFVPFDAEIDPVGRVMGVGPGFVTRLTPDGLPDSRVSGTLPSSGPRGGFPNFGEIHAQADGNILVSGQESGNGPPLGGVLARLLGNGPPAGFAPSTQGTVQVGGATDGTVVPLSPDANGIYQTTPAPPFFNHMGAFPGSAANVRVATADVNGDGTPDYIDGTGPGGPPDVVVFDGKTGNVLAEFAPFETSFTGGVFVAGGDLNGDGRAEIVATPDQGGGPNVVLFSLDANGLLAPPRAFFALGNPSFRGGARPAVGDVNGDGAPDLAVGAGFLGGPVVEIHDGKAIAAGIFDRLIGSGFFAFDGPDASTLRNGVYLAIGDLNGDGFGDLVAGAGPGGGPRVLTLSGKFLSAGDAAGAYAAPLTNFFFDDPSHRGGVRVATTNADGDAKADLILGSGEGERPAAVFYLGKNFTSTDAPTLFGFVNPFTNDPLPGGVFVG